MMNLKQQTIRTIITATVLIIFLLVTTPSSLPVGLLIVPFVLLFIFLYQLIVSISLLVAKLRGVEGSSADYVARARVFSGFLLLLILLQSLGQLSVRDVISFGLVFAFGYLYVRRLKAGKQKS